MVKNKAKILICHHPGGLFLYKNFAKIIKKYDKNSEIILFKVNHPYFLNFDFMIYEQYFDKIIEFDFLDYKINFPLAFWRIFNFQKKIKKIIRNYLVNFKEIDLFLDNSAWLPINILLYNLSKERNIKNINKITLSDLGSAQTKTDRLKTSFCALYSLFFNYYKIKVISTLNGQFVNFVYTENTPGIILKIINPTVDLPNCLDNSEKQKILPYPIFSTNFSYNKKDMVIIFGDNTLYSSYAEYYPDYGTYVEKTKTIFRNIEKKYYDCKLYYKPHPADNGKIMPGIEQGKYSLFDNTISSEMLFDKYHGKIRAIYSHSSTSVIIGSFFGVPSYTFYRYLCNEPGIEYFDNFLNQSYLKSKFIFHLSNLNEIGKIDNFKRPKHLDINNINSEYLKLLNI